MAYKAFIASTYEDLKEHRAYVIKALDFAGIAVDPMENWSANAGTPKDFSAAALDGCDLCILLVSFRRGTVPHGEHRSITQIEYEESVRRGIDVLPFILLDSEGGNGGWNPAYDERTKDPEVVVWREKLRSRHGVQTFCSRPDSLNVGAAIARWVVSKEDRRQLRLKRIVKSATAMLLAIVSIIGAYVYYLSTSPQARNLYISKILEYHDGAIFNNSSGRIYEVARVLPDNNSLVSETRLTEEVEGTSQTLDMLANTAGSVRTSQYRSILSALLRGVNVRIILFDYSERNQQNYDAFARAVGQEPGEAREAAKNVKADFEKLTKELDGEKRRNPNAIIGKLTLRWNRNPLLYSMWIRDMGSDNAIGHLGVHFYLGKSEWPNIRVSPRDGNRLLENMSKEFEKSWKNSVTSIEEG